MVKTEFPDFTENVRITVTEPAQRAEEARVAAEAEQAAIDAQAAQNAQIQAPVVTYYTAPAPVVAMKSSGLLAGSYGYVSGISNCVEFAKMFGKNQPGNPISWGITTRTPFVGAAVLFYFNHVGIVTGIHADGSIEVAHANCPGCSTHYSAGEVRGYF